MWLCKPIVHITFQHYFDEVDSDAQLIVHFLQVFVGKAKDGLNLVNSDLVISEVTPLFGPWIYILPVVEDELAAHVPQEGCELNAISIMMTAHQEIARK